MAKCPDHQPMECPICLRKICANCRKGHRHRGWRYKRAMRKRYRVKIERR